MSKDNPADPLSLDQYEKELLQGIIDSMRDQCIASDLPKDFTIYEWSIMKPNKTLKEQVEQLEAESDSKISYEYRKDIWRKIRLGLHLSDQEKMIHDYDLECFKLTGKWN